MADTSSDEPDHGHSSAAKCKTMELPSAHLPDNRRCSLPPLLRGRSKRLSYGHAVACTGGSAFATGPLRLKYHQPADRKIGISLPKLQGFVGLPGVRLGSRPPGRARVAARNRLQLRLARVRAGFHTQSGRSPCASRLLACRGVPAQGRLFKRPCVRLARPRQSAMPATVPSSDAPKVSG